MGILHGKLLKAVRITEHSVNLLGLFFHCIEIDPCKYATMHICIVYLWI